MGKLMKRAKVLSLAAGVVAVLLAACQPQAGSPGSTPLPTLVPLPYEVVLQYMIDSGELDNGAVIAQMSGDTPVLVWRYRNGNLREGDAQDYYDAMGSNPAKWPPQTVEFTILTETATSAEAWISYLYDTGHAPDSRGGQGGVLTLNLVDGEWQTSWEVNTIWD